MGFCFKFSTHFRTCLPMCRRAEPKRTASTQHGIDCRVECIFVICLWGCVVVVKFVDEQKTHTTQHTYSTLNY